MADLNEIAKELNDLDNDLDNVDNVDNVDNDDPPAPPTPEEILSAIAKLIPPNASLDESFYEMVLKRLVSLGYEFKADDSWLIWFSGHKVEERIKNECNISLIPEELRYKSVDIVCGEFLRTKKDTGQLDTGSIGTIIGGGEVTQIKEGDTTISFSSTSAAGSDGSGGDTLDGFIASLLESWSEIICYRRIRW